MIAIDGSYGEGGGQILRTSLALSLVTGKPFRITKIRAGRRKPGLMRQHLTAVNAATAIGQAHVAGNTIGSTELSFEPGRVKAGEYHFAIGTAGSCTLVLQTVLPALMVAENPSSLILEGGTHNPYSPSFDFLEKVFLPLLKRMGPDVKVELKRPGFYPAGGGCFTVTVQPQKNLKPIEIMERGRCIEKTVSAVVSEISPDIAKRELKAINRKLKWPDQCLNTIEVTNSRGPGNVLNVELRYEHLTELFIGFGERGVSSETVAGKTAKLVKEYLKHEAPVGRYLADQLLIPIAMSGSGRFKTLPLTNHTKTNMSIIQTFLDVDMKAKVYDSGDREISVHS